MRKKIIKDIIAIVIIAILALFFEFIVFQWQACVNPKYVQTLNLEDAKVKTVNGETTYSFEMENRYVRYIYLYFSSEDNISFEISGMSIDGYGQDEKYEITDTGSAILGRSAISLEKRVNSIEISMNDDSVNQLDSVEISNKFVFFPSRFLLVFAGLLIGYLLLVHREFFTEKTEAVYLMIALSLGIVIIMSSHYALDSWDEQIHYNNVYVESWIGRQVQYSDSAMSNVELRIPIADTIEEERWIGQWLDEHNAQIVLINGKGLFLNYNQFAYIPMILGLMIGRLLHLHYTTTFFLGKFLNLLFCTGMVALGIRFSKYGKRIMMCIGLVPTGLFLFSSYSYDGFVLSLLMLGLSLFMTEFMEKEKQNWFRIMGSVLAITVGCFSKAVYIPLLAIYWMLPREKFYSKKQMYWFKVLIGVVILLVLATFVLPVLGGVASGTEIAGDYRGGNTSQSGQMGMIFGYPLHYAWILLRSIGVTFANYFWGPEVLCNFAYRGIYRGLGAFLVSATLLLAYLHDYKVEEVNTNTEISLGGGKKMLRMKLFMAFLIFGTISLIWTALYLDFTPVGNNIINGVSPRYYLPLLLPFSFLFINRKFGCYLSKAKYQNLLGILMYVGTALALYSQMML